MSERIARGGDKGQRPLLRAHTPNALRRAQGALLPATNENPLRDARLNIGLDPLIDDFDHLFSEIGEIVETSQLKGFERSLRARRKVIEHWFRCFHAQPPVFTEVGPREVANGRRI